MPDAQIDLMVVQDDRAADTNPSRMAALPAYRDGKEMPKAFANPMGLNDRLAVGGLWPWSRGCGGGGIGKTGLAEHGWAQSSAEDRALRGWHRWAFARARSADAVLAGFAGQVRPAHLTCRYAHARAPRLRKLGICRHAKAALGGASLRLLRVSLFGAGQGLWPRDRRRKSVFL